MQHAGSFANPDAQSLEMKPSLRPRAKPMELPPDTPQCLSLALFPAAFPIPAGCGPPSEAFPTPRGWLAPSPNADTELTNTMGTATSRATQTDPQTRAAPTCAQKVHARLSSCPMQASPRWVCQAEAEPRCLTWRGAGLPGPHTHAAVHLAAVLLEGLLALQQQVDVLEELLHQRQHLVGGRGELLEAHL